MRERMTRLAVALLLLAVAPATAAEEVDAADMQRAQAFLGKADRALKSGNLRKAEELYRQSLKVVPDHPEGFIGLGHIQMQRRQFEQARDSFEAARRSYGSMSGAVRELREQRYRDAQEQLIRARRRQMELGSAIQRAEASGLSEGPTSDGGGGGAGGPGGGGNGRPPSGQRAGGGGPGAAALRAQLRAVEQQILRLETLQPPRFADGDPVPGEVHFFLGNALLNLDRLDEAIEQWELCVEKDPEFPWVHNNLAVAYWKRMEIPRAVESLERAEALGFPVNPQFKRDLGESYERFLSVLEAAAESGAP